MGERNRSDSCDLGPLFANPPPEPPPPPVATRWRLSPSDFAFLWEECKRCFYLKVVKEFYRPRSLMPKIFNVIDAQMKGGT